jgi:hypothetical protein
MNATTIYQNLFATLERDLVSYQAMTRFLREALVVQEHLPAQGSSVAPNPADIDLVVTQAVSDEPFTSAHHLAQITYLRESTVYYHFVNTLGFAGMDLRWVPHMLPHDQKSVRFEISKTALRQIGSAPDNGW